MEVDLWGEAMVKSKVMDIRKAKLLGYGLSACFLLIHVVMILLFHRYGVKPMVYFNIFSICFYLVSFLMLRADMLWLYTITVYLEVAAHMTLAAVFVGAEAGFQVTLIGMNVLLFYSEYLSNVLNRRRVPGLALSLLGMLLYMFTYVYRKHYTPLYSLPMELNFQLQIAWGFVVSVIVIFFLKLFVLLASRSERFLSDQATHDPLTGLYNRAGYEQLLAGLDISQTALLLVDADHFKAVNDTHGHEAGDRVLKKIADALYANFRPDDPICRIGGDEFAVLMHCPDGMREALIEARIKDVNSTLSDTADGVPHSSVSAGAAYGADADSIEQLFAHADEALYQRKEAGRGGCSFYRPPRRAAL